MSLATVEDLATYLGTSFTSGQADRAQLLLDIASGSIQRFARQVIELVEDDVAILGGTWASGLVLPQVPVVSVSAVSTEVDGTLTPDADWVFDGRRTLWRGSRIPNGLDQDATCRHWGGPEAKVTVTYTHGWAEIPAEFVGVCLQIAARGWRNPAAVSSESVGQYAVTYGSAAQGLALTADEKTVLSGLRRKWVGAL